MYNKKFNKLVKAKPEMFDGYDCQMPKGDYTKEQREKIEASLPPLARKLLAERRGG